MRTLLLAACMSANAVASAQTPAERCGSSTPYDACALTVDGLSIRRGRDATILARDGWVSPLRLVPLVAGSDSAHALAALHDRRATLAFRTRLAGAAAMVAGLALYSTRSRMPGGYRRDATPLEGGLVIGGSAALLGSAIATNRAYRLRERAVWWYNRDLVTP